MPGAQNQAFRVPYGCVYTSMAYPTLLYPIKAQSSIFPMVIYPRFMSLFL